MFVLSTTKNFLKMKNAPTQEVRHDELLNGDKIYVQGYLFIVNDLRSYQDNGVTVIRYTGKCSTCSEGQERNAQIINSGYNGGTYGARADVSALIHKRN